jgi:RHS repeat-associated protein
MDPMGSDRIVAVVPLIGKGTLADPVRLVVAGPTSLASGMPGVGARSTPTGKGVADVSLGPLDQVAPSAVRRDTLATTPWPNRLDMQCAGATDNSSGVGFWQYQISRNGVFQGGLAKASWSDTTVSPNTTYTYSVVTVDRHGNQSTATEFQVVTPAAGAVDPRKIGVRPLGSYWGAAGENIDMQTGNLNFTLPLLSVPGRGGMKLNVALSYNSLNWRQDAAGTWLLGEDVGYGFGWKLLAGATTSGLGTHYFTYGANGAGELTKITLPYQAEVSWQYSDFGYFSGKTFREVTWRGLKSQPGGTTDGWTLTWDSGDGNLYLHNARVLADPTGTADKRWTFQTNTTSPYAGLLLTYAERSLPGPTELVRQDSTWAQSPSLQPYVQSATSYLNPGTPAEKASRTTQSIDGYGNLLQQDIYDYTSLSTPARTYTYTYLGGGDYTSRYIRNRLMTVSVTGGGVTRTLVSRKYDNGATYPCSWGIAPADGARLHDDATYTTSFVWRGNVTSERLLGESKRCFGYDLLGNALTQWNGSGQRVDGQYSQNWNYVVPTVAYPNSNTSLTETRAYNTFLGLTELDTPNSVTQAFTWDALARPASTQSPHGAVTNYSYTTSPLTVTATTNGKWVKTTKDGLGRPIKEERGYGSTTVSTVDTEYGACACSPVGKLKRVSRPYAPGQTPVWTTYTYDARGRTLSVTPPGNAGSTTYSYAGNTVTVTEPSGTRWKKYTVDVFGNLVHVTEPEPSSAFVFQFQDSFATPPIPPQYQTVPSGTVGPWTVGGSGIDRIGGYWQSADGDGASIDLNGSGPGSISTSLSSVPGWAAGATYRVSFSLAGNPDTLIYAPGATRAGVRVTTATSSQDYYFDVSDIDGHGGDASRGNMGWKRISFQFVAGALDTLSFASLDPPGDPWGPALDNVVVEVVSSQSSPHETSYEYNAFNQMTQVQMPRGTTTQTRTWTYDANQWLTSETHPETGTTQYGYDSLGRRSSKVDAKNQRTEWTYDSYNRVTQVRHYTWASGAWMEWEDQREDYVYDTGTNGLGRLTQINYGYGCSETFSYTAGGLVASKGIGGCTWSSTLTSTYTYDNEGKVLTVRYPAAGYPPPSPGLLLTYGYDAMGRPVSLDSGGGTLISNVQYNAAGQWTSLTQLGVWGRTWAYNSRGQLTRETAQYQMDFEYRYSATANDGRVWQRKDWVSGEEVTYQYDALGRLARAETTSGEWGLSWVYDGFGNRLQQNVVKGTGPQVTIGVDPATNRVLGVTYDANGNMVPAGYGYDLSNRLSNAAGEAYSYSSRNERILLDKMDGTREIHFYGAEGLLYGVYRVVMVNIPGMATWCYLDPDPERQRIYFAGPLMFEGGAAVVTDRLGSVANGRRYYPYGEEMGTVTPQDRAKYATYTRDASTGLDYAKNRYYKSTWGRFTTADPYRASGGPADPQSWNRYAYVENDPVNYHDPWGLYRYVAPSQGPTIGGPIPSPSDDTGLGGAGAVGMIGSDGMETVEQGEIEGAIGGRGLVQPKVPAGNNYTAAQMLALTNGLNNALTHTDQVDCATFYAGGDDDPSLATANVLENTTYRLLRLPQGPGGTSPPGAETADRTNVFINTAGAFFTAAPSANGTVTVTMPNTAGVPMSSTFANTATLQGFILLHELGHQMGVFGADTNAATNGANSQAVLDHCFRRDAQGVYH